MKRIITMGIITALTFTILSGCESSAELPVSGETTARAADTAASSMESNIAETAVTANLKAASIDELRDGTSGRTLATTDDFPDEYFYGSGTAADWSSGNMLRKMPEPRDGQTVLNAVPDTSKIEVFYLWEENKAPAVTKFTENMTGYFDEYDFRPYVTSIPVRDGVEPKGAVVLMAGGAYQFRGNYTDSLPTAANLRELGFQTFIVDYRLRPYNQEEGALDVARAVRFIRKNADVYGIDPDDIAVMGFSAGGIQAGEFLMHYDENVTPDSLDPAYVPDVLDKIPARYFLYENNHSIHQNIKDEISKRLGVQPIMINSALVSAQQRKRCYWTNIPGVTQPTDKGILLKDIIDNAVPWQGKAYCLTANYDGASFYDSMKRHKRTMVAEPVRIGDIGGNSREHRVYSVHGKAVSICANGGGQGAVTGLYKIDLPDGDYLIRKLSPVECERLQTLPDNYTAGVSDRQRYRQLGNGWTVDVIAHILGGLT